MGLTSLDWSQVREGWTIQPLDISAVSGESTVNLVGSARRKAECLNAVFLGNIYVICLISVMQYCTVLYYNVLYFTVMYCTVICLISVIQAKNRQI